MNLNTSTEKRELSHAHAHASIISITAEELISKRSLHSARTKNSRAKWWHAIIPVIAGLVFFGGGLAIAFFLVTP